MEYVVWFLIGAIVFILGKSLFDFIHGEQLQHYMRRRGFSLELFYVLITIYCIVIIGFGLIYFVLSMQAPILVEHGELKQVSVFGSLMHSLYFSGVTILTIGYGDITPIGVGRLIAIVQALIGYILPTAFVLRLVQRHDQSRDQ
ncbi:potassium channel family protein [Cerasibacillus sp. JNUCC 74]